MIDFLFTFKILEVQHLGSTYCQFGPFGPGPAKKIPWTVDFFTSTCKKTKYLEDLDDDWWINDHVTSR